MRIISGKARGTKLYTLEGDNTRPTLDRVRESIFNIIHNEIPESVVLDLFAGSGAVGLEFASRGSKKVYMCDNSKKAIEIIERNIEKTHLNDKVELFNCDFKTVLSKFGEEKIDIIYLDPPYLITFSEYNKLWNEDSEIRLIHFLDELNDRGIRFAVSNVLWHRRRYNGTFNEWAQQYKIVRIQSNYISYHDNTEKDSYEVLVKNY